MSKLKDEKIFLTMKEYEEIAIQAIKSWDVVSGQFVQNADLVNFVMTKIMEGDWKWQQSRKCARTTYRHSCANWAIREFMFSKKREQKKRKSLNLYSYHQDPFFQDVLTNDARESRRIEISTENLPYLSELELKCLVKIYVEKYRVSDLAQELGKSRTRIYCIHNEAIEKLRHVILGYNQHETAI